MIKAGNGGDEGLLPAKVWKQLVRKSGFRSPEKILLYFVFAGW